MSSTLVRADRTSENNRRILLISYHFPPSSAVGGIRIKNFAKFMPDFGWQPEVLTIDTAYIENPDWQRLEDIPALKVHRTVRLPTAAQAYLLLKDLIQPRRNPTGRETASPPPLKAHNREKSKDRLKRYLFSLILGLPDFERNWILPAVWRGYQLIRQGRVEFILTSCPPFSVHLIGLMLAVLTNVRWIADFRDPWITGSRKRLYFTSAWSMAIEGWLERQVLRKAQFVTTNTARLAGLLGASHSNRVQGKLFHVPNGFDVQLFTPFHRVSKFTPFTLTYTGSLYFGRSPKPIFHALRELMDEGHLDPRDVKVNLVGHCRHVGDLDTLQMVKAYDLLEQVNVLPPVPYNKSLELIARSHLALLFAPDQPFQIPAKIYDYLGIGTPILAIAGDGASADLIRDTDTGVVFATTDAAEIKAYIQSCYADRQRQPEVRPDILERFEYRNVVRAMLSRLILPPD